MVRFVPRVGELFFGIINKIVKGEGLSPVRGSYSDTKETYPNFSSLSPARGSYSFEAIGLNLGQCLSPVRGSYSSNLDVELDVKEFVPPMRGSYSFEYIDLPRVLVICPPCRGVIP